MFKILKKFKLFLNIKRVVSSSLIALGIFSNVSLNAVSFSESVDFVQDAGRIITGAKNLCSKINNFLNSKSDWLTKSILESIYYNIDYESKYIEKLVIHLNNISSSESPDVISSIDISMCDEQTQLTFYKHAYNQLKELECFFDSLNYFDKETDYKILKGLLMLTEGHISNL